MKRFVLFVLAVMAVSAIALASVSAQASDAVSFADPAGDSGGELDVSTVSVDTDVATGTITFAVTVTGFDSASMDGRRRDIQVYLAPDASSSAGGSELALIVMAGPQGLVPYVGHPNPVSWPFEPLPPSISFSQSGNVLAWRFNKTEFGSGDGFNFLMYTQITDAVGSTSHIADHAPDGVGRWWHYAYAESAPPPVAPPTPVVVRPAFGSVTTAPSHPVAGKRLVFTLPVTRSDTGEPLTTGRMVCDPSIGRIVLKHTESFKNGKARLSLLVPKWATGKLLKIRVKITTGGQSATKVVNYKVI